MAAASEVQICNRALQLLGATRITSLLQDSVNARACSTAYESIRDAELRAHRWNFAIARASLAADSVAPTWGRANSYQLPADFLKLIPLYPEDEFQTKDWVIEGQKIVTDDGAPLYIRYIKKVTDPAIMDPIFREAVSAAMAMALCEELTQSNTKIQNVSQFYKERIALARKSNGIEVVPAMPAADTWETSRL